MIRPTRRRAVQLIGGVVGAAAVPFNFGCADGGPLVRDSHYLPTPEQPLTPTEQWYVNYCCGQPAIPERADWRLRVKGLVDRDLTLGFDDLMRFPQTEMELTLECVGNRPDGQLISAGLFAGVRLRDVLAEAGVSGRARGIVCEGLDGFPSFVSVDTARSDEPMVVHTMNGAPLEPVHGAPVRILYPGRYGVFSVKWLDSITATRRYAHYGAFRGLSANVGGETPVRSRLDWPSDGRTVLVDREVEVRGLAVTAGVGIDRVEVRADEEWRPAELTFNTVRQPRSPYLWTLWRFAWTPRQTGRQVLSVRAFDVDGRTQAREAEWPYDSGAIHSIRVVVVS